MSAAADPRRQQLARIHIAKKMLDLDEASYRCLLLRVGGHESSADMDARQRAAVLREFAKLGFKAEARSRRRWPGEPKDCASRPMLGKVRALLADGHKPWAYAHAMAERMFGTARVEWLHDGDLHKLVAAMQIDARRHGGKGAA